MPIERRINLHDPDVVAFHLNVKDIRGMTYIYYFNYDLLF